MTSITLHRKYQQKPETAATLEELRADVPATPQFAYPNGVFTDVVAFLELTATFEPVGIGAYQGAAPALESKDILAAAGSIAGVEGEHVVAVNWLLGGVPYANEAFPKALTLGEVSAAVAPLLGGKMLSTGGPKLFPMDAHRLGHL